MVSVCLPSDALSQHLPSYLGFSYLGLEVSPHSSSSKVQLLLLTLDKGYLLTADPPDLECEIAPLGPPAPMQPPLLGRCLMLLISLFYRRPTIKFREVRLAQDHTASENHINNVRPDLFDLNTHDISCSILRRRQWHPTPVLLPGISHGRRSLVGCGPWGSEESDTTE